MFLLQNQRRSDITEHCPPHPLHDVLLLWFPPGLSEEDNQWMTQINRLQKLIDRLEKKVSVSTPYSLTYFAGSPDPMLLNASAPVYALRVEYLG